MPEQFKPHLPGWKSLENHKETDSGRIAAKLAELKVKLDETAERVEKRRKVRVVLTIISGIALATWVFFRLIPQL